MYCRNCGNKLLDTDKFCYNCGSKVILNDEITEKIKNIERNEKSESKENLKEEKNTNLPMNWWNFWQYFRFPVGICGAIIYLIQIFALMSDNPINIYGVSLLLLYIALIIFCCITFYYFIKRKKQGFNLLMIYSIAEIVFNAFLTIFTNTKTYISDSITEMVVTTFIIIGIFCAIWIFPNYIYFKKRKYLFKN